MNQISIDFGKALQISARLISLGFSDVKKLGRALLGAKYELTPPQIDYLELLLEGLSDQEITDRMGFLEVQQTKNFGQEIRKKLNAANRTQAALIASRYLVWD